MDADANGKSSVLSCPNMGGSMPYIDKCRNYAAIILLAAPETEIQKAFFTNFKDKIDSQISPTCK
jgi:hypothetical protein